ncbi:MAG: hypothetical protein LBC40_08745 [Dysgonamonadaceae bacterium]|jgi:hypothetical protein|nr:hypothetical protein [Dysgonamonadaceae bacterium]
MERIQKFLKRFLPDYKELRGKESIRPIVNELYAPKIVDGIMAACYFNDALQNFATEICREQCKICADIYNENLGYTQSDNYLYNKILEAENPNIEEL